MWNRRDLKSDAKKVVKRNYIQFVVVCMVIAILAGGYSSSRISLDFREAPSKIHTPSIVESALDILDNLGIKTIYSDEEKVIEKVENKFNLRNATEGVFATIINNSGASRSFLVGLLNTINQFIFENRFLDSTIMAIATLMAAAFWIFIQNILIVGQSRFFLENKNYGSTKIDRVLFVYRVNETLNVAYVMFCRYLFNLLWFFTIVGGVVKYYSYRMIPYILAENPKIKRREAFKLSEEMMKGNKWDAFKLDVSFVGWRILSLLTYGVVRYLYVNPYIGAVNAELYFVLRERAIGEKIPYSEYLNDIYLTSPVKVGEGTYPVELYTIEEKHRRDWLKLDYDRSYSITSYILVFFTISFIGWLWEVFLHLLRDGTFVNRGTMMGPWLPIYGTGALLMLILLKPFVEKPLLLFPSAMVICGILEYFTSWMLEKLFHTAWWDYSNVFFNINGRICLEGLLFFAVGGFLIIYFVAPLVDEVGDYFSLGAKRGFCGILIASFLFDFSHSFKEPNMGEGITSSIVEPLKKIEVDGNYLCNIK
ncbi:DUF975 family protein [Anaerosphaera multitolerans]|uniref:DUF975 family protein n=1 Tax=Anaerosphaera multitolerans TaxID=2487351 RepID=A0A437S7G7_9FIRM|nr:DUF975 family protein [Anaerosphaera multitolerans]RVU55015.1 DUF975 family protein [Anaerosphaera multitolerans]